MGWFLLGDLPLAGLWHCLVGAGAFWFVLCVGVIYGSWLLVLWGAILDLARVLALDLPLVLLLGRYFGWAGFSWCFFFCGLFNIGSWLLVLGFLFCFVCGWLIYGFGW